MALKTFVSWYKKNPRWFTPSLASPPLRTGRTRWRGGGGGSVAFDQGNSAENHLPHRHRLLLGCGGRREPKRKFLSIVRKEKMKLGFTSSIASRMKYLAGTREPTLLHPQSLAPPAPLPAPPPWRRLRNRTPPAPIEEAGPEPHPRLNAVG